MYLISGGNMQLQLVMS